MTAFRTPSLMFPKRESMPPIRHHRLLSTHMHDCWALLALQPDVARPTVSDHTDDAAQHAEAKREGLNPAGPHVSEHADAEKEHTKERPHDDAGRYDGLRI